MRSRSMPRVLAEIAGSGTRVESQSRSRRIGKGVADAASLRDFARFVFVELREL